MHVAWGGNTYDGCEAGAEGEVEGRGCYELRRITAGEQGPHVGIGGVDHEDVEGLARECRVLGHLWDPSEVPRVQNAAGGASLAGDLEQEHDGAGAVVGVDGRHAHWHPQIVDDRGYVQRQRTDAVGGEAPEQVFLRGAEDRA